VPPVRITSSEEPDNSAAIFTALVITVRLSKFRSALAMAVVVVPESSITTWPCFYHAGSGGGDVQLFPAVEFFLFPQSGIFQHTLARRQRPAVSAMDPPMPMKYVQVFPDGDLRSVKLFCQVSDQDTAVPVQDFQDHSAALFVQHRFTRDGSLFH